jgi:hypothetical protein
MIPTWLVKGAALAWELGSEFWRERQKKRKAAAEWAARPAPIRACFRCKEIAYTPGQVECAKCGALL